MEWKVTDFSSPQIVGLHMQESAARSRNMQEPMSRIVLDMMRIEKLVFKQRGRRGRYGTRWAPLAPATVKKKGHDIPLVESGALKESLTEPGAPYQIVDITRYGLGFGTNRPWAFVHQYGSKSLFIDTEGTRGGTRPSIPARPFLYMLPGDMKRWNQWILSYLTKPFTRRGISSETWKFIIDKFER